MREIVLDTETTGLDPALGHRLVEIGALELFNHIPTGRTFHVYINPERDMPAEAEAVHGLSALFLRSQPKFAEIAHQLSEFIADSTIIIHNAAFDLGFLNAELALLGREPILPARIVDTLQLARLKHPMGPNSLDALCKRYGIDNSKRTRHGALLDSELLAEVYIELIGGRQITLSLDSISRTPKIEIRNVLSASARPRPLPIRMNAMERDAHAKLVEELGPKSMWKLLE